MHIVTHDYSFADTFVVVLINCVVSIINLELRFFLLL
jgi:hypothetical protein